MGYIVGEKPQGCILCLKHKEPPASDRQNHILYRGKRCYVMLNLFPYTNGHLMIAPYIHEGNLENLDAESLQEMTVIGQRAVALLKRVLNPDGFNLGMNIGHVAGAGVAAHLHLHVVPRWQGDANFMSVLANTRLIPEALDATHDRLLAGMKEEGWGAGGL